MAPPVRYTILLSFFVLLSFAGKGASVEARLHRGQKATKLFVFGDSYADTGNTNKTLTGAWKVPYGITFPGQPTGRYSDGRVLTDYIARFLGTKSPVPYRVIDTKERSGSIEEGVKTQVTQRKGARQKIKSSKYPESSYTS